MIMCGVIFKCIKKEINVDTNTRFQKSPFASHYKGTRQDKLVQSSQGWITKSVGVPEAWSPLNSNSGNIVKTLPFSKPPRVSSNHRFFNKCNSKSNGIITCYENLFLSILLHHVKIVGGPESSYPVYRC